jgi:hypothetical protein
MFIDDRADTCEAILNGSKCLPFLSSGHITCIVVMLCRG